MPDNTKIALSPKEAELVYNKEWLYLKRDIIGKVFDFFGDLHDEFKSIAEKNGHRFLPVATTGKIARGENLQGLPYVMMDYPSVFRKEKIVAVRTLFWWGNFFSISLHVAGLKTPVENLDAWIEYFRKCGFSLSTHRDQWNYEFSQENFSSIDAPPASYADKINESGVFRVSAKCSLNFDEARQHLIEGFGQIVLFLNTNFPVDERGPLPGFPIANWHP